MSITAPVYDKSDPRNAQYTAFHLPLTPEWEKQKGLFGQTSMMGAGAGMFLRNPVMIWSSVFTSTMAVVNHTPYREEKDAQSPWFSVLLSIAGVVALEMPKFMLAPEVVPVTP